MKLYNYFNGKFHSEDGVDYLDSTIIIPTTLNSGGLKPLGSCFLHSNDNVSWFLRNACMTSPVVTFDTARAWDSFDQYCVRGGEAHFNSMAPVWALNDSGMLQPRVATSAATEFINVIEVPFGSNLLQLYRYSNTCYIAKKGPFDGSWSSVKTWVGGELRGACTSGSEMLITTVLSSQGRYGLFDREFNIISEGTTPIIGKVTREGDKWFLRSSSSGTLYHATTYTSSSMNWTACVGITGSAVRSIAYGNGVYVAITSSGVLRSTDGVNWSSVTALSGSYGNYEWVGFVNGEFLIFRASTSLYAASTDGSTWTNRDINSSVPISSITIAMVRTFGENEVY